MVTRITVSNKKGGGGKTSTAVNLAHAIARNGERTLIIDADQQANASDAVGQRNIDMVYEMFDAIRDADGLHPRREPEELILATGITNLDIICGGPRSAVVEPVHKAIGIDLRTAVGMLEHASEGYDYVVIDTPPQGYMQQVAVAAADILVIPTELSTFAIKGMEEMTDLHNALSQQLSLVPTPPIIVPARVDMREREAKEQYAWLSENYRKQVAVPIPKATAISSAQSFAQTIFQHHNHSNAAKAYEELANQICMNNFTVEAVGLEA